MNLQEDIDRIKEVMGINEISYKSYVKRRLPSLIHAVIEAADWLTKIESETFDNFLKRAVFSGVRDILEDEDIDFVLLSEIEESLFNYFRNDKEAQKNIMGIYNRGINF